MRTLFILFSALSATVTLGCGGDDPAPLFADLQWQVQCKIAGGCAGIPNRSINNLDGEDEHDITCNVTTVDAVQFLTFRAFLGTDFGMSVTNARFPDGGGPLIGTDAVVEVEEGGNRFQGNAGANTPTTGQPCRISNLRISEESDGPTIFADLLCVGLPARAAPSLIREVTFPGASYDETTATMADPAKIRIVNCDGL